MTIREMTIADYDEVVALWRASEGVGLSSADERGAAAAYLERNARTSFVAVEGGRILGAALCGTDDRRGYLHHLAVAADCRRRGIGRALADRCLAALKACGIARCHIHVFAGNGEGRAFWSAIGWRLRDDLVVMSKDA
jgi:ribosomal protein S18 acetylase RimI-like enzyme